MQNFTSRETANPRTEICTPRSLEEEIVVGIPLRDLSPPPRTRFRPRARDQRSEDLRVTIIITIISIIIIITIIIYIYIERERYTYTYDNYIHYIYTYMYVRSLGFTHHEAGRPVQARIRGNKKHGCSRRVWSGFVGKVAFETGSRGQSLVVPEHSSTLRNFAKIHHILLAHTRTHARSRQKSRSPE